MNEIILSTVRCKNGKLFVENRHVPYHFLITKKGTDKFSEGDKILLEVRENKVLNVYDKWEFEVVEKITGVFLMPQNIKIYSEYDGAIFSKSNIPTLQEVIYSFIGKEEKEKAKKEKAKKERKEFLENIVVPFLNSVKDSFGVWELESSSIAKDLFISGGEWGNIICDKPIVEEEDAKYVFAEFNSRGEMLAEERGLTPITLTNESHLNLDKYKYTEKNFPSFKKWFEERNIDKVFIDGIQCGYWVQNKEEEE